MELYLVKTICVTECHTRYVLVRDTCGLRRWEMNRREPFFCFCFFFPGKRSHLRGPTTGSLYARAKSAPRGWTYHRKRLFDDEMVGRSWPVALALTVVLGTYNDHFPNNLLDFFLLS